MKLSHSKPGNYDGDGVCSGTGETVIRLIHSVGRSWIPKAKKVICDTANGALADGTAALCQGLLAWP